MARLRGSVRVLVSSGSGSGSSTSLTLCRFSAVQGHQSALAFGYLGSNRTPVVCQLGR